MKGTFCFDHQGAMQPKRLETAKHRFEYDTWCTDSNSLPSQ